MKIMIYESLFDNNDKSKNPRKFALIPTIVREPHPTLKRNWLVWLEWFEIQGRYKWLIEQDHK